MVTVDYSGKRAADINPSDTTVTVFVAADNSAKAAVLYVPAKAKLFRVRAGGTATGGTTTNFTPTIQWGNSTTASSNTDIAAATARAFNSASGSWEVDALVHFDSLSSKMHGTKSGWNGTTPTIESAAVITDLTSITTIDNKPICVNGLFSAASTGNKAVLDFLTLEVLAQAK